MEKTLFEKLALILSRSEMYREILSYHDALMLLKERYSDEEELRRVATEAHQRTVLTGKIFGLPYVEDFDEWVNIESRSH